MGHRNFCTEALLQKFLYPIVQKISVKSRWINLLFGKKILTSNCRVPQLMPTLHWPERTTLSHTTLEISWWLLISIFYFIILRKRFVNTFFDKWHFKTVAYYRWNSFCKIFKKIHIVLKCTSHRGYAQASTASTEFSVTGNCSLNRRYEWAPG